MLPSAATASLVGTIPVVVTGGVVMKFTKAMFDNPMTPKRRRAGRARSRRRSRSSNYPYGSSPF